MFDRALKTTRNYRFQIDSIVIILGDGLKIFYWSNIVYMSTEITADATPLQADETAKFIENVKRSKAPEIDDIPAEVFQAWKAAVDDLADLLIRIWDKKIF